jgi:hypothetical protein
MIDFSKVNRIRDIASLDDNFHKSPELIYLAVNITRQIKDQYHPSCYTRKPILRNPPDLSIDQIEISKVKGQVVEDYIPLTNRLWWTHFFYIDTIN